MLYTVLNNYMDKENKEEGVRRPEGKGNSQQWDFLSVCASVSLHF